MGNESLASRLLEMAARRSVSTPFGWSHPDCVALSEAARILRGMPVPQEQAGAVLSTITSYVTPEH